jgi:hypothetical protein
MVSIVAILTTKGTRDVVPKIVFFLSLVFIVISPLGVLVPLILVSPSRLVFWGWFWFPPGPGLLLFWFLPLFLALFNGWVGFSVFSCSKWWTC